jgi:hypothetical protein
VGVVDISAVDTYSRVEVCTPIFLGERLTNNVGSKLFLKKNSKLNWTHPLTKLNTNKSSYVEEYLDLVGTCMSLRNFSIFIQLRSISKSRFS